MSIIAPLSPDDKNLGAYYTAQEVADFLVRWAVKTNTDRILDPSFGGGVFLHAACRQLAQFHGNPAQSVLGVELDSAAHGQVCLALQHEYGVPGSQLTRADFFSLEPGSISVDAVVGNPPFIRYQRFSGACRQRAIQVAASGGVRLSELSSSWAPFVVHSTSMLRFGGRLGFVLPAEIMHAAYARPILEFLNRTFANISFVTFRRRLFPELSQDTLLLLADAKTCNASARVRLRQLNDSHDLVKIPIGTGRPVAKRSLRMASVVNGTDRFAKQLLPKGVRDLYDSLAQHPRVARLDQLADVGIGYVTGGNDFFHLGKEDAEKWEIPQQFLRPALCRGRGLAGLVFSAADWERAAANREAALLLHLPNKDTPLPKEVRAYIEFGEARGVHRAFKCRTRSPWYRVPHVREADAFLSYMSGTLPKFAVNRARAVAPNTLHVVRMHPLSNVSSSTIALSWQSSLTQLSAEIEGHAMGGGLLKLEPKEAERILVALPQFPQDVLFKHVQTLDVMVRQIPEPAMQKIVDNLILVSQLGLTPSDCTALKRAAECLRMRRMPKAG